MLNSPAERLRRTLWVDLYDCIRLLAKSDHKLSIIVFNLED